MSNIDYIIVGLGNPGRQYENTRHNSGFRALDYIANNLGADINREKFKSLICDVSLGGKRVLLLKPQTYMNLSGQAVTEAMSFYKVPPENVLIIFDDISLPVGKIRIRKSGSHGGQNGVKNIIALS
ncbi:MAG: aminoacyl-tRNA hydrolase, partial [Clostridia bacterium]|nr:aminoacyl-tRNA hydrolase [Clostridia bacterium]